MWISTAASAQLWYDFRYRSCCGSPQAADVRLACETMLVGNAGISVCFHFCK